MIRTQGFFITLLATFLAMPWAMANTQSRRTPGKGDAERMLSELRGYNEGIALSFVGAEQALLAKGFQLQNIIAVNSPSHLDPSYILVSLEVSYRRLLTLPTTGSDQAMTVKETSILRIDCAVDIEAVDLHCSLPKGMSVRSERQVTGGTGISSTGG